MLYQKTINFIKECFSSPEFIPLHAPVFAGNEREYVNDTLDSTFVSSVGEYVDRFENMMAQISGTSGAVATVNGTAGLQMALKLAGVKPEDEVITQALTFVATANAIAYNGAQPVFIDVDRDTMGLSPVAVKNFLEEYAEVRENGTFNKLTNKRISACLPMHTFGFMNRIDELVSLCDTWGIPVVEDAAEALGSKYKGKPAGSFGALGAFSFNGNKIVTCGGGGAIVSNNIDLVKKGKYLTTTAKKPHKWEYEHDDIGYNFRLPNINAALACGQLERLEGFIENKKVLSEQYHEYFQKHDEGMIYRTDPENCVSNNWLMCVELKDKEQRDLFLEETNANGVMTRPIWQLMFRLPMYGNCFKDEQKNAIYLESRIVNIPSSVRA